MAATRNADEKPLTTLGTGTDLLKSVADSSASAATVNDIIAVDDRNHWRIFINNTYLIPDDYNDANTLTCILQKERAELLGKMIRRHKPDVVLLQEMWGASYAALQNAMQPRALAKATITAAKEIAAAQRRRGGSGGGQTHLPPPHLQSVLEQLSAMHDASAETIGIPQAGGTSEEEIRRMCAADPHLEAERAAGVRVCAKEKQGAGMTVGNATDSSKDFTVRDALLAARYASTSLSQSMSSTSTLSVAAKTKEKKEAGKRAGAAGGEEAEVVAAVVGLVVPHPQHLLPPLYRIPFWMRPWGGSEFFDAATQFYSFRGGLMHAHNINSVMLMEEGGFFEMGTVAKIKSGEGSNSQRPTHTNASSAASFFSVPLLIPYLLRKAKAAVVAYLSGGGSGEGGFLPVLCQRRHYIDGPRGLLKANGCGVIAAMAAHDAMVREEKARREKKANTKEKDAKEKKKGDSYIENKDASPDDEAEEEVAADGGDKRATTDKDGADLVSRLSALLTAGGRKTFQLTAALVVPSYPRHHTFLTTNFPRHNKSAMVIKACKKPLTSPFTSSSLLLLSSSSPSSPPIPLLIFNTHLDPCNLGPRHRIIERQLIELKAFIADVVEREWAAMLVENNGVGFEGEGRGETSSTEQCFSAPFAAVIAGDFNIPADHPFLYDRLFQIMRNGEMTIPLSNKKGWGGDDDDGNDASLSAHPPPPPQPFGGKGSSELAAALEQLNTVGAGACPADSHAARLAEYINSIEESVCPLFEAGGGATRGHGGEGISRHRHRRVLRTCVDLQPLLSEESLGVHTYCCSNIYVQHPKDEGRLDHIFAIRGVSVTMLLEDVCEEKEKSGAQSCGAKPEEKDTVVTATNNDGEASSSSPIKSSHPTSSRRFIEKTLHIKLAPVSLVYERVLNDHKGGDALVSDHYPFVVDLVVGEEGKRS